MKTRTLTNEYSTYVFDLSDAELAALLVGVQLYESGFKDGVPPGDLDTATNCGQHAFLLEDECLALSETINTQPEELTWNLNTIHIPQEDRKILWPFDEEASYPTLMKSEYGFLVVIPNEPEDFSKLTEEPGLSDPTLTVFNKAKELGVLNIWFSPDGSTKKYLPQFPTVK